MLFEFLPVLRVLLLDLDDLILVVALQLVDLFVVDILQVLARLLRVNIFGLNLDHVGFELLEEAVDGFLVLLLKLLDARLVMLLHLQFLLFKFEEVAAFDVEFALVDALEVLHGRQVISLHLLHGL